MVYQTHTFMLLVNRAHQRCGRRQNFVNEDEDSLLRRELYSLADDIDELTDGQIGGDKIFLLVNSRNI